MRSCHSLWLLLTMGVTIQVAVPGRKWLTHFLPCGWCRKKKAWKPQMSKMKFPAPNISSSSNMDFLATGIAVDLVGLTSFRVLLFTHKVYHFRPTTKGPRLALEVLLSTSQSFTKLPPYWGTNVHWYQVFYNDISMFTRGTGVWPSPRSLMVTILVLMCSHWGPIYSTKMILVVTEIMGWGTAQDIARKHGDIEICPTLRALEDLPPDFMIWIYIYMKVHQHVYHELITLGYTPSFGQSC